MPNRQADPDAKVTLLVQRDRNGDFTIQIPASWKVTFGAVNPGNGNVGRHDLHCLRIYEGEKLRAVYCDVRGFRDLSIPMAVKVSKETGSASWVHDSDGNFERSERRQIEEHFETGDRVAPEDIPF
jgi:hypothetical protein